MKRLGAARAAARIVRGGVKPLPYVLLAAASVLSAQDRAIPFWPDAVPDAIHAEIDGVATLESLARRPDGEVLAYEALNLADGTRSVSEIRDVLSPRYSPVTAAAVAVYFELLAKAGAVSFR